MKPVGADHNLRQRLGRIRDDQIIMKKLTMNRSQQVHLLIGMAGFAMILTVLLALPAVTHSASTRQAIQQWTAATSLPEPAIPRSVVGIYNNQRYLYIIGGKSTATTPVTTVRRSAVNNDGSLAGWQSTTPLPVALYSHAVIASGDGRFLYVLGGWNGNTRVKTVYRAEVGANGMLGGWATLTALPEEIAQHATVLVNNRIYMIGGQNNASTHNKVSVTTIRPDGTLSGWVSVTALPQPVERLSAVVINDTIYATGGSNGSQTGGAFSSVYYSKINSNGTLAGWQTTNLPSPLYYHQALVHDGRLVILGGTTEEINGSRQVWSSTVNSGGWLNGWQAEPDLPKSLYRMAAVSLQLNGSDTIFVVGGLEGTTYQTGAYRSAVAPTYTPTPLPTATPTPGLQAFLLRNQPAGTIQPGDEVRYTIYYRNGPHALTNFAIENTIPQEVVLVPGSISNGGTSTGQQPGNRVQWALGNLAANATGSVSYAVAAPTCPHRIEGTVFEDVNHDGIWQPATESSLAAAKIFLQEMGATVTTTSGGFYYFTLSGPGTYHLIETDPPGYTSLANSPNSRTVTVGSCQIVIVNFGDVLRTSAENAVALPQMDMPTIVTATTAITAAQPVTTAMVLSSTLAISANQTLPDMPPQTDRAAQAVSITNQGATASWRYNNVADQMTSNRATNPSHILYVPILIRRR